MSNKLNKIVFILISILFLLAISTQVKAIEWINKYDSYKVLAGDEHTEGERFAPYEIDVDGTERWLFCIEHGKAYRASYDERYDDGYILPNLYCDYCKDELPELPKTKVDGVEYTTTMEYTLKREISAKDHMDVAYILANTDSENYRNIAEDIWSTDLNAGKEETAGQIGNEAAAYLDFYKNIHNSSGGDIFKSLLKDKTTNAKATTNSDNSYTVGPFKFEYPEGRHNGENKFSWISSITGKTDVGDVTIQLLWSDGTTISGYRKKWSYNIK